MTPVDFYAPHHQTVAFSMNSPCIRQASETGQRRDIMISLAPEYLTRAAGCASSELHDLM
jgi:hypothetical protein